MKHFETYTYNISFISRGTLPTCLEYNKTRAFSACFISGLPSIIAEKYEEKTREDERLRKHNFKLHLMLTPL